MRTKHLTSGPRRAGGAPAALFEPGERLGDRYELGAILGRGGMAEVRDGWDTKLGRPVAIKLLHPSIDRPENRVRFETEARATAALHSTHIVVVHDVGEHHGMPFIVMERLPGVSLADHIARGPLPQRFVQQVLDAVLAGLTSAHDAGILHRDVKPGNILFTAAGEAKLADFGIAKTTGGAHTMTGQVVGTMAYLSPDRLLGKPATPADDLYAVGVVGYEALTGRRPFRQEALGPLAHAILNEKPPPVAALRPDVRPGLATVIAHSMTRNSAQRFHQASALRAALNSPEPIRKPRRTPTLTMTPPAHFTGTQSTSESSESEPDRPWGLLWVGAVISVIFLAITLLALAFHPTAAPPPSPVSTSQLPTPTTAMETPPDTPISSAPAPPPGPPQRGPGKKPKNKGD